MFRLSRWLRKSYRCAIEANIRRTRWSDLSTGFSAGGRRLRCGPTVATSLLAWGVHASPRTGRMVARYRSELTTQPVYRDYCGPPWRMAAR